jgi:hypothetical protein
MSAHLKRKRRKLFYVGSKRGRTAHLSIGITEGMRTLCGVLIPYATWKWACDDTAVRAARKHLCKKCKAKQP